MSLKRFCFALGDKTRKKKTCSEGKFILHLSYNFISTYFTISLKTFCFPLGVKTRERKTCSEGKLFLHLSYNFIFTCLQNVLWMERKEKVLQNFRIICNLDLDREFELSFPKGKHQLPQVWRQANQLRAGFHGCFQEDTQVPLPIPVFVPVRLLPSL